LYSDDGTVGTHGFVDAGVRKILSENRDFAGVLACGPRPMLRAVSKVAEELKIPCQVSMEERMACGVGACLGCAIQMADGTMKHVCKDGPVFDSREVLWNA
ncbi:MAG: dihydroorotate dehydrogenase electron transfer subunit, partial [Oscillospiraceae bacterium]